MPALPPPPRQPGEAPARRGGGRSRGLSVDEIADAAMAIVDADGLDALTMRAVATVLRTGAASLYGYVESKEALVDLLIERVLGEMGIGGAPDPAHWRDQLKRMAVQMRGVYARHNDLARASFGRIPLGEKALVGAEWMTSVMRAGGLSDRVIGLGVDLFALYIGAIAYEDSLDGRAGRTPEAMGEFVAAMQAYYAALPAERFPSLISLAAALTSQEDRFEFGLDVIIAGLEAVDRAHQ